MFEYLPRGHMVPELRRLGQLIESGNEQGVIDFINSCTSNYLRSVLHVPAPDTSLADKIVQHSFERALGILIRKNALFVDFDVLNAACATRNVIMLRALLDYKLGADVRQVRVSSWSALGGQICSVEKVYPANCWKASPLMTAIQNDDAACIYELMRCKEQFDYFWSNKPYLITAMVIWDSNKCFDLFKQYHVRMRNGLKHATLSALIQEDLTTFTKCFERGAVLSKSAMSWAVQMMCAPERYTKSAKFVEVALKNALPRDYLISAELKSYILPVKEFCECCVRAGVEVDTEFHSRFDRAFDAAKLHMARSTKSEIYYAARLCGSKLDSHLIKTIYDYSRHDAKKVKLRLHPFRNFPGI